MTPRNDDISLKLVKAVKSGFLPDVSNSELDSLEAEAKNLLRDDTAFGNEFRNGNFTRRYRTGAYYGTDNRANSSGAHGVGTLYAVPFWVADTFAADRLACEVTVAAATATFRMGIYNSTDDDLPNLLQLQTASMDGATTGVKEATIDYTFKPGLYWLSFVNQVAAISTRTLSTAFHVPPVAPDSFLGNGAGLEASCYYRGAINGNLPADWAGSKLIGAGPPKLMVRAK